MNNIDEFIANEELKLEQSVSINEKIGILYNLIIFNNSILKNKDNYKNIKKLIGYCIEQIKISDYGYDTINYNKLNTVLIFLGYKEQIAIYKYSLSTLKRELPEHDTEWFLNKLNRAEINDILCNRKFIKYPKAIFLIASTDLKSLLIILLLFIGVVYLVLLPSHYSSLAIFNITYENYSSNFYVNHMLNILSLFSDLDNDFKIVSINGLGLLEIILAKIIFLLLIVNFIYKKVSDKISIK